MVCTSRTGAAAIAGGFVRIPVADLAAAWDACRQRPLAIADFRVWLAAREITARRQKIADDRAPIYPIAELAALCEVSQRRAMASVRRLVGTGLLAWSEAAIGFPPRPLPAGPWADTIGKAEGSVSIPRRVLRFLCAGQAASTIAVAIAAQLRCLSRRRSGWDGRGRFKISWVAATFGVSPRQAKAARKSLIAIGWLKPEPSPQWAENRWGRAYRIDLSWSASHPATQGGSISAPPTAPAGPVSAPPVPDPDPLPRAIKNQEPAPGGPAGVRLSGVSAPGRPLPEPRLADVRPEDLQETGRLLELHREAVARELIGPSEADLIRFLAAAEHARAVGRANPPGLFAHLVRGACWRYLTQGDEDRAGARLKAWLRGPDPAPMARPASRPELSEDARTAREIRRSLAASGYRGDPFPPLRRHDPTWTRERWDAALCELGGRDGRA